MTKEQEDEMLDDPLPAKSYGLNPSDTPRTDAATIDCGWDTTQPVVPKPFAQELEQEIARMQRDLDSMASELYDTAAVFDFQDTIGGEPLHEYVARMVKKERNNDPSELARIIRQLESITLCAENALETMPHGSDRYDIAVAIDQSRELFKELFIQSGGAK